MGFCLSNNLNFYLQQQGFQVEEWQLFLLMNPIGFNYFGLTGDNYELLNGINNTTEGFLNRAIEPLGFRKKVVETELDVHEVQEKKMLLEVDDYYLEYNPFYHKYHNTRFVVATGNTDDNYEVYDTEQKTVSRESLKNSVLSVFELEEKNKIDQERINSLLLERFQQAAPFMKEEAIENIRRFASELAENFESLTKEHYNSLFFFVNRPVGPATIQQMTGNFLSKLSEKSGSQGSSILLERAEKLKTLAELWLIIGNLFFKLSRKESRKTLDSICSRLQEVIEMEKQI